MRLVELLNNPEDLRSKEEKCKEVGVTRKTMYEWLKIPEFVEYMIKELDKYTDGALPDIWRAHLLQAKRGNMDAIRTYYKMKKLDEELKLKLEELRLKQQIEMEKLRIEKEKLELARRKFGIDDEDDMLDDGFIDALNAEAPSVWSDEE